MKIAGRLALLASFAMIGAGLAVRVGLSEPAVEPRAETPVLAARIHTVDDSVIAGPLAPTTDRPSDASDAAKAEPETTAASASCAASVLTVKEPGEATVVAPSLSYAQQATPSSGGGVLPDMLRLLRKNLAPSQPVAEAVPAPPPVGDSDAAAGRANATVSGEGDGKLRIHIYDEDIRKVLDLLGEQGNLNILASKNVEGKVSATLNGVDVDSALAAILKSTGFVSRREGSFIFVGTPEDFMNIEQGMDRVATRIYRPNYITSAELQLLIKPLLTDKIGVVSVSSPAEAGIATNDSNAGGNKFSGDEVVVVRDFQAVLTQIDQLVAEVDVRPLLVSIEAMILSVKLSDEDQFGVNFQLLRQNPNIKFGLGSPPASLSATDFPLDGGLKFGFLDSNLGAFIEALESVGDTNVIANPRLTVLNKQRAEIQIGEKKGYINQTVTETSSSQSVEFLDIGTQLRLRPFISSDGLIRMEVHPELSDGDVKVENDFTLPNKTLTQVTTNVMVRDGCTVIIGGLIKEQLTSTTSQVPLLGSLPLVGFAFRQTNEKTERHEVLVLITPRIVYEPGTCREGAKGACEFLRRQATYADKMSPFGKRSIARRYFRLAVKEYALGNREKALRFAEMSVQFNPVDRAALELRSDIWLGKPYRDPAVAACPQPANPLEGDGMAAWLIDDLEKSPPAPVIPLHPLDRGLPGRHTNLAKPNVLQ